MRRSYLIIIFVFVSIFALGRSYTDLQKWREKGLPSQMKKGVLVEVYDFKEAPNDNIYLNIRSHNLDSKSVTELSVKVWFWKDEGVFVEEFFLIKGDSYFNTLNSGKEEYYPRKGNYYKVTGIKYSEVTKLQLEISRIVSKRAR